MELGSIRDAFDRVAKKQKLSYSKTQEVIDLVGQEIAQALAKLQGVNDPANTDNCQSIVTELNGKLKEAAPLIQLEGSQKELNVGLSKYAKLLEKYFNPDISKAYRNVDFDTHTINQIIACHFYRQGLFDLGDCFMNEAKESLVALKSPYMEMYQILEAMKSRNLEPAIEWAATHRDHLVQSGSILELKLHRLQFVEILQKGERDNALQYAKTNLSRFATGHMAEFQKLMGGLLWAGKLECSPYPNILSPTHWENLAEELTQQFCNLLGQSYESPLNVVIEAGVQGLPTLLKLANVMAAKKQEWLAMKQLPVPLDLGREFQFHSIFVCPVSRDQGSEENPPMLMPCGHVLCKQSIVKLSKSSTRTFKCPYCPLEATVAQCIEFEFKKMPIGGAALDLVGVPLPDETLSVAKQSHAVLLGASGGYKWDSNEKHLKLETGLLQLRAGLGVFVNLRRATVLPQLVDSSTLKKEVAEGVDLMVVRELTGGCHSASQLILNDYLKSIDHISRIAFETAQKRCGKLCSVDKVNVLEVP
ncbi:hypothetical protein IFM89_003856 [Coptis chinensis]|uniref:Uncharacterized protein n=1 Tax=Coptis chinensis TaxID=261450 RepID=A0A835HYB8_9MAGN|nr:hypothetical protein IFM89_003856 [Coptis chinensis]